MAIGDAYASEADYVAFKGRPVVGNTGGITETYLKAVSRYLDHKLGRRSGFNQDASATNRIYFPKVSSPMREDWAESENPWLYGGRPRVLDVEDTVSITSITVDTNNDNTYATTLASTDYELRPVNAATGPEPRPYNQIAMTPWGSYSAWPAGRVKVNGIHGWPSVPDAIKIATIELAAILRIQSPFATGTINELDQVVETSAQARAILMGLMTNYSAGMKF